MDLRFTLIAVFVLLTTVLNADDEENDEGKHREFSVLSLTYLKTNTDFAPELDLKGAGVSFERYSFDHDGSFSAYGLSMSEVATYDFGLEIGDIGFNYLWGHTFDGFTPFAKLNWGRKKTTLTMDDEDIKEVIRGWDYGFGFIFHPKDALIVLTTSNLRRRSDGVDFSADIIFKVSKMNSMRLGYARTVNTPKDSDAATVGWSWNF